MVWMLVLTGCLGWPLELQLTKGGGGGPAAAASCELRAGMLGSCGR